MTPPDMTPAQIAERLDAIEGRLDRGAEKMDAQSAALGALRDELAVNTATTEAVRELLDVARSGLKVLGWLGVAARWLGTLATAAMAIYAFVYAVTHGGQLPPKP